MNSHWRRNQIAVVASGFQFAAILLKRTTARAVIVTASLAAAASLATFALVESAWLLMVTITLFGLGAGTALTTACTAAGPVVPRHAHGWGSAF